MIKRIWYGLLYAYVYVGLRFYFSKIVVRGRAHIPSTGPVLFLANHQNALLDALLTVTSQPRRMHFLARADLFRKPLVRWLLGTINMAPVYRIRDGWASLQNNEQSFQHARNIFLKGETLLLFPEGNHDLHRRLRPLSKGFTRIVLDFLSQPGQSDLTIIPVGLNYDDHRGYRSRVSVCFGEGISTRKFLSGDPVVDARLLREAVSHAMKKLIVHIEPSADYEQIILSLKQANINLLNPDDVHQWLRHPGTIERHHSTSAGLRWLRHVPELINLPPLLLWRKMARNIQDPVFTGTARFGVGISVFPIYYVFLLGAMAWWSPAWLTILTAVVLFSSMPLYGWLCRR